jgi:DNA-binding MarR family transcriptional regulator
MTKTAAAADAAKLREMTTQCACLNARKVSRQLSQLYDSVLRPAGIRSTQLPLLATIGIRGPMLLTELADAVVLDRTTLTRSLAHLERNGWVKTRSGVDLRTREIHLTPAGRRVLQRAMPLWDEAQSRVRGALGALAAEQLVAGLAAAVGNMDGLGPDSE